MTQWEYDAETGEIIAPKSVDWNGNVPIIAFLRRQRNGEEHANGRVMAAAPNMRDALEHLVGIIEAAGLLQLSRGVELGPTVWYVKAVGAMDYARRVLDAAATGHVGEKA